MVATLDREKKHGGVTAFLVDPKTPGITIGDFPMRTLKRDNLAEVHFEDAFVPDEALLGAPGKGFPVLGSALDTGRFSVAARCVGQAQRCLDLARAVRDAARGVRPADRRVPAHPGEDRARWRAARRRRARSSTSSAA